MTGEGSGFPAHLLDLSATAKVKGAGEAGEPDGETLPIGAGEMPGEGCDLLEHWEPLWVSLKWVERGGFL